MDALKRICENEGIKVVMSDHWAHGGKGAAEMAEMVADTLEKEKADFKPLYTESMSCREKIETVAKEIYRAKNVIFTDNALKQLPNNNFPICIAKTQYSFSDDATRLNAPEGHDFTVREIIVKHGAEFNARRKHME